jgi:acyl-homoserine lactone acylase PvdQ
MRTPALSLALLLVAAAPAPAAVVRAENILPPGQSGFVSATGVASGTGSPHLSDQLPLFVDFKRKNALFDQPGETEKPRDDVTITRDGFGIPSVRAQSEQAMWWGAGYAVAQDRLFQLELFRRATTGRLAEILGESYLDDDLIARRDYYTAAERAEMLGRLSPTLRARIAAYRDGVNAWISHVRTSPQDLPGEFAALAVPLTDWTEDDSVAVGIFLARTVPSGSGVELQNLRALRAIGADAFNRLLPLRTPGRLPTVPAGEGTFPSQPGRTPRQERAALRRTVRESASWQLPSAKASAAARANVAEGLIGRVGGSYMFATRRASDGHAFLFNGPQLGYSIPELFVELELHAPGVDLRGVTAAGVPLIGIGWNGQVAWGFTSGLSDEDDLYAEELVPDQPERYRFRGEVRSMECRDERFTYRSPPTDLLSFPETTPGAGEKVERICRTVHGPVEERGGRQAYARRYAIWGRELETIDGLTQLNAARSIAEVDAAMQNVTWNENVMAVDSAGNMGFWHPGLHPLRPVGFDERLPYPGTGEAEWRGLLDRRTQTPRVINPEQGFLFNWNNVPSEGWTSGDAEARERLTGRYHRGTWLSWLARDLAREPSFERLQGAVHRAGTTAQQRPLAARKLRVARKGAKGRAAQVIDALLAWDGSYDRVDSRNTVDPGVAIWETFKAEAADLALDRLASPLGAARDVAGKTSTSHEFDMTNGEAFAMRVLSRHGWRQAADATFAKLADRFDTEDIARWRDPRKMYDVQVQGAAAKPEMPFYDRGTYEQLIELGPG